jgi:hypothetical protein
MPFGLTFQEKLALTVAALLFIASLAAWWWW